MLVLTGCPDRLTITADASTDTHEDLLRVHVEILKICLTGLLLAQFGCAGVGPTRSGMASLRADMQDILEGQKAMAQRFEALKSRIELLEDRVAGLALSRRVRPAPRRTARPIPERSFPSTGSSLPPANITQRDLQRLDRADGIELPQPETSTRRQPAVGGPRTRLDDPIEAFKSAENLFRGGNQRGALKQLEAYVKRWPKHGYADNAVIYIGNVKFRMAQYKAALDSYKRVLADYPEGNQVPMALLMIGQTLNRLGHRQQAIDTLQRLKTMFPATKAGKRAVGVLNKLTAKGN